MESVEVLLADTSKCHLNISCNTIAFKLYCVDQITSPLIAIFDGRCIEHRVMDCGDFTREQLGVDPAIA